MADILHIGYPKTGSTWFQKEFYPKVANCSYVPRQLVQKEFLIPGGFEWDKEKCISSVVDKSACQIICEELLLGRLRSGGVKHFLTKEVANRLNAVFPNGKVILFLRNQPEVLVSAYYQYIKSGGNYNISRFLFPETISRGDYNPLVLLGIDYFDYLPVIDYYEQLFGKENISLYLFEDFRESPRSFMEKFSEENELEVNFGDIDFTPINDGYRPVLVPFRRFCNAFTRTGPLHKYYLLHFPYMDLVNSFVFYRLNKYLRNFKKPRPEKVLGKRNYSVVCKRFRKSNNEIINRYGLVGMEKHNYPL